MNAETAFEKYRAKLIRSYALIAVAVIALEIIMCFTISERIIERRTGEIFMFNAAAALCIISAVYKTGVITIEFRYENDSKITARQYVLEQQVQRDRMTGLLNHEAFFSRLTEAMRKSEETGTPLTLAMVDIDNFKRVNDTYGHENGDIVLVTLARIMEEHCGENGIVCRYGGEEFVVIFPYRNSCAARRTMEDILEDLKQRKFSFTQTPVTFSCGICSYNIQCETASDFFNRADEAMYCAKRSGKARIIEK